jgi:hypothetical protein
MAKFRNGGSGSANKKTPGPNVQNLARQLKAKVSCGDTHHRDRKKAESKLERLKNEYDLKCVGIQ